ncbi:MAG: D-Ala-D-Ala carboxypeptidase family metallohydrolase [Azovibrio sp.]|uniref:D-Ala-D-Ala carboxypeptidase family metallohydrolase n=1 Tax=Azovibrio sp. TaxID=1872673 RepID=UPI003C74AFF2
MKLSNNFTLDELTVTDTGLFNTPNAEHLANLVKLADTLEKVRAVLGGKPIKINSGYRSVDVNKTVGGARASAHLTGMAADFVCPGFGSPLEVCQAVKEAGITLDQLIHEHGRWVHIGINQSPRMQYLTIDKQGTRTGLLEARL